jgi:hypothetical protein
VSKIGSTGGNGELRAEFKGFVLNISTSTHFEQGGS